MSELSGADLDKAIAQALGYTLADPDDAPYWDSYQRDWVQFAYLDEHSDTRELPAWSTDANLQLTLCAERGWALSFCGAEKNPSARFATVTVFDDNEEAEYAEYQRMTETTYQEAGACAIYAALQALKGAS